MFEAVQKRGIVYTGTFFLLAELIVVFVERYRALFKLVTKIDTGILFFEKIPVKITEFLPLYGKGRKGVNTVLSVLPYKTISFFFDS